MKQALVYPCAGHLAMVGTRCRFAPRPSGLYSEQRFLLHTGPAMIKEWSIRNRILSLAMFPTMILAAVLGAFFIHGHLKDLDKELSQRALMMARQLAQICEYGVIRQDQEVLQRIISGVLEERDVRAVNIYNQDLQLLTHTGPQMLKEGLSNTEVMDNELHLIRTKESVRVKAPVFASNLISLVGQELADKEPGTASYLLGWAEIELSTTNTRLTQYQYIASSSTIIGLVLIIFALVCVQIANRLSRPVEAIVDTLNDIQEGRLESRAHIYEGGILSKIASGVNSLAAMIQRINSDYQQSIEQATRENQETIDELEIRNHELTLGRQQALEASRIKSEFLANVSHEIRTPLNGIVGYYGVLERTQTSERQKEYLHNIRNSTQDLQKIISDILDLSKLDAGKLFIENTPINLRDVIEETLQVLAPSAAEKNLELIQFIDADIPEYLFGDRLRLKQVLSNLIANAVKFTPSGSVSVRVYPIRKVATRINLQFDVKDTGIGMSEAEQARLFQAFSQADASIARQYGGTGLGLIISKALIEAMNGDIQVTSAPGRGSVFSFTLETDIARCKEPPQKPLENLNIVLIDHNNDMRQDSDGLLTQRGAQVESFKNAEDFFVRLEHEAPETLPDCVIYSIHSQMRPEVFSAQVNLCMRHSIPVIPLVSGNPANSENIVPRVLRSMALSRPYTQHRMLSQIALVTGLSFNETPEKDAQGQDAATPPTVLAVDDNEPNLKLLITLLQDMGVQVISASSGFEAVAIAEKTPVDLVLMDIRMPGMSGAEATRRIREIPGISNLPVVAVTAHAMADERQALMNAGMNDYQTKPISQEELARVVERWTGFHPRVTSFPPVPTSPRRDTEIFSQELALQRSSGNLTLATEMFVKLTESLEGEQERIVSLWENESLDELLEAVHRLHGATRYCGVPALSNALEYFETRLKANTSDEFPQAMRRLVEELNNLRSWVRGNNWVESLNQEHAARMANA
ncbi:MAG TPA: hypothetical protein DEA26_02475 [Oceanospirillales bacterium]|nr:hypothetical protein [Oceanospirillales bacterium]